jgi:cell division septum initiation protein DivIVA
MKKLSLAILLLLSLSTLAQITIEELNQELEPLAEKFETLQSENSKLKSEIRTLNSKLSTTNKSIDSLRNQTQVNSNAISQTANQLGIQIKETGDKNEGKITKVSESLSKNSLYGIIGVLSAILLSGLLYWLLSKRQQTDKTDFIDQLSKTKSSIEESLVKEFGKQTELMDSQLHLIEQQKTNLQATPNAELDHTLALKVCGQINVMENNLIRMDQNVKGIKHIKRSIENLKDNLMANGYEMPELLGKQFHQGMKAIKTATIQDENIEKDSEVITKVLIPQVNYNDKMIQTAQIEVSVG